MQRGLLAWSLSLILGATLQVCNFFSPLGVVLLQVSIPIL